MYLIRVVSFEFPHHIAFCCLITYLQSIENTQKFVVVTTEKMLK